MKRPPDPFDPQTPEQWQEAVDLAAAARMVADCKMYGIIRGGPEINVARCDDLIERGKARGVQPSRPVTELALELIASTNAAAIE